MAEWRAAHLEAVAALTDALEWRLPAQRWEHIQTVLAEMAEAAAAGSTDRLWHATANLELCGPQRVGTRLGDAAEPGDMKTPVPKAVRDRIVELTHTLGDRTAADDEPEPGTQSGP
ncbi:MAG TPA: CATRA system-associated protein [Streptosporangiaceae bacterium]|nr:CATRA system-associated protein [Streptosporangiaceae bacterium]